MKKGFVILFGLAVSMGMIAAAAHHRYTYRRPIPHFEVILAENGNGGAEGELTLELSPGKAPVAVVDSAATISQAIPIEEECANVQLFYEGALRVENSDTEALAYEAVHCNVFAGMDQDAAELLFKVYRLQKQDWVEQGRSLAWWRWKWRAPDDKKKHRISAATLEVEFRHGVLARSILTVTMPEGTLEDTKGSL